MFEKIETISDGPTPFPQVDSSLIRVDYFTTPLMPTCERPGYPEGDFIQLCVRLTYENGERYAKVIPISFSALKCLVEDTEKNPNRGGTVYTSGEKLEIEYERTSIEAEIAAIIRPIQKEPYATPSP